MAESHVLLPDLAARGHRQWSQSALTLELAPVSTHGVLVAIEGADGAGKTTLARALAGALHSASIPVITTRLPTAVIRRSRLFRLFVREGRRDQVDYVALQVMHMADRLQHQFEIILPALQAGHVVVSDRYLLATLEVMTRYGDTEIDWLRDLSRRLVRPDLWFLLHAPSAVATARIHARADERDSVIDAERYEAGNRMRLELAKAHSMACIDTASRPLASYLQPLINDVQDRLVSKQQSLI